MLKRTRRAYSSRRSKTGRPWLLPLDEETGPTEVTRTSVSQGRRRRRRRRRPMHRRAAGPGLQLCREEEGLHLQPLHQVCTHSSNENHPTKLTRMPPYQVCTHSSNENPPTKLMRMPLHQVSTHSSNENPPTKLMRMPLHQVSTHSLSLQ
jgi:hypothetical protein